MLPSFLAVETLSVEFATAYMLKFGTFTSSCALKCCGYAVQAAMSEVTIEGQGATRLLDCLEDCSDDDEESASSRLRCKSAASFISSFLRASISLRANRSFLEFSKVWVKSDTFFEASFYYL